MAESNFFTKVILVLFFGFSVFGNKLPTNVTPELNLVTNWPQYKDFGQLAGVSVDSNGNVYIFHRGENVWDQSSFLFNDVYAKQNEGPIKNSTIVVLEPNTGSLILATGRDLFYLPHGLTVDYENNIWVTDVALHQVFKFPPLTFLANKKELAEPLLVLGTKFSPGNDLTHFCKPTDVAVDSLTGEFFISDGYCNSRIIKYHKNGTQLLEWGRRPGISAPTLYTLTVPHALTLVAEKSILFVADRENMRIIAYNSANGSVDQVFGQDMRSKIFSVAYSSKRGGLIYAVAPPANSVIGQGVVYHLPDLQVKDKFSPPQGFKSPHDVAVSPDGKFCYVVELNPYTIWKFHADDSNDVEGETKSESPVAKEKRIKTLDQDVLPSHQRDDDFVGGTPLAVILVISILVVALLLFMYHLYKRKGGYKKFEMKELILDDDDEDG